MFGHNAGLSFEGLPREGVCVCLCTTDYSLGKTGRAGFIVKPSCVAEVSLYSFFGLWISDTEGSEER